MSSIKAKPPRPTSPPPKPPVALKGCFKCGADFIAPRHSRRTICDNCKKNNRGKTKEQVFSATLDQLRADGKTPEEDLDEIIEKYKELIQTAGEDNQLLIKAINLRIKELINHFIDTFNNPD